ncbi:Uncharacterised protein [Salmonella enterica subsp. enterica]|nr:Uncharacterised protein [Salmonella enterica subsp. enterica] [Salmonella enterica subsp. enterica serovar Florida]
MKQKRSTFLQKIKSSVESLNMNNTIYNVFWSLSLTATHTADKSPPYFLSCYVYCTARRDTYHTGCFYQTIDKLIDMSIIKPTKFKYQHRLNPVFFSFLK